MLLVKEAKLGSLHPSGDATQTMRHFPPNNEVKCPSTPFPPPSRFLSVFYFGFLLGGKKQVVLLLCKVWPYEASISPAPVSRISECLGGVYSQLSLCVIQTSFEKARGEDPGGLCPAQLSSTLHAGLSVVTVLRPAHSFLGRPCWLLPILHPWIIFLLCVQLDTHLHVHWLVGGPRVGVGFPC